MQTKDAIQWLKDNPSSDSELDQILIEQLETGLIVARWDLDQNQPRFFAAEYAPPLCAYYENE